MPIAITQEQLAVQASIRERAKQAGTLAVVRSLEPASARAGEDGGWNDLAGLGVFLIARPAAAGGVGATVADLAAVLEQITDALLPGPPVMPILLSAAAERALGQPRDEVR